MKHCSHCDQPAAFSVCTVISTLGLPDRRQECTASLPFCSSCLQRVCAESEGCLALQIKESLQMALRALTEQHRSEPEPETHPDQTDNGLEAAKLS
jgi:hypothetical protein